MAYYFTLGTIGTAATNVAAAIQTTPENVTQSQITIPSDVSRITKIGHAHTISAAQIADTGNGLVLRISGNGLVDGEQNIVLGGLWSDETGTSVTGAGFLAPAIYEDVSIWVNPGQQISLATFYNGTDSGSQVVVVTLEMN